MLSASSSGTFSSCTQVPGPNMAPSPCPLTAAAEDLWWRMRAWQVQVGVSGMRAADSRMRIGVWRMQSGV